MGKTLLVGVAVFALNAAPSLLFAQAPPSAMRAPADSTAPIPTDAPRAPESPTQGSVVPVPPSDGTTTVTTTKTTTATSPQAPKGTAAGKGVTMTTEQKTVYATWPAERQSAYEALPIESRTYYWTLTPEQQNGYWALTPDQRGQIYRMTPEQRAIAWKSVQEQLAGQDPTTPAGQANPPGQGVPTAGVPNPQAANQAVQPAIPAEQGYQGGPYKGALTPPPADSMEKDYPVCSRTVTDGCKNKGGR